jgi:hypothetical protein
VNSDLIARMRDIHDLDVPSWWPPAPGWWLLLLATAATVTLLYLGIRSLLRYPFGSWHRDARNQLLALHRLLPQLTAEQALRELSELLRRIAVVRIGRKEAAGLNGEAWLEWLEQQDPEKFPWRREGRALIIVPYSPPGHYKISREQVERLIQAALAWARKERS